MENGADPAAMQDHSGHAGHGGGGHSMSMSFHFGVDEVILFPGWKVETSSQMVWSCLAVFVFGLIFEAIKWFRGYLLRRERRPNNPESVEIDGPDGKVRVVSRTTFFSKVCNRSHAVQTLLHILQFLVGYTLMLIFMTYNVYLCMAVTIGIGTGYFLFGSGERVPAAGDIQNGDCCH